MLIDSTSEIKKKILASISVTTESFASDGYSSWQKSIDV